MPVYLMLTKLTERGRRRIMERPERIREVNLEVEAMGVKILEQFFLMGPYDFVNVIRADDNWSASQVALELSSRGTLETSTYPALEMEGFINYLKFMKEAKHKRQSK